VAELSEETGPELGEIVEIWLDEEGFIIHGKLEKTTQYLSFLIRSTSQHFFRKQRQQKSWKREDSRPCDAQQRYVDDPFLPRLQEVQAGDELVLAEKVRKDVDQRHGEGGLVDVRKVQK